MSGWDPRGHRTAREKAKAQDPTVRKLNRSAQLAPSVPVATVLCAADGCGHVEMAHGERSHLCLRPGCPCTGWVEP